MVIAFPGPAVHPAAAAAHGAMRAAQAEGLLDDDRAVGFTVSIDPADDAEGGPRDAVPDLRVFRDGDGPVSRLYGVVAPGDAPGDAPGSTRYALCAFLLDPLLRVIAMAPIERIGELLDLLRRLPEPALHTGFEVPAPVLVLPRVMEPEFCRRLIAVHEAGGGEESGFMVERGGKTVGVYDPATKKRRDQEITEEPLRAALRACITRRFAVTINLHDDFNGGMLWFPEFGPRRYRPPLGGAAVFSCSLLHEATPVTRGVRFATLPFLYGDAAARIRQQNAHSLVPEEPTLDSEAAA